MNIKKTWYSLIVSFPIPYKYLIGVGMYFYVKSYFPRKDGMSYHRKEWYLFIPAIVSETMWLYWYYIKETGINKDILIEVYQTGFFAYNEIAFLFFNLILGITGLRFMMKNRQQFVMKGKNLQRWKWLKLFLQFFLIYSLLNFTNQIISLLFDLQDSVTIYAFVLIVNTIYIYWIGFVGYTQSDILFKPFHIKHEPDESNELLSQKLLQLIQVDQLFKNPNIKIADLASKLDISVKDLSLFINEKYQMNFSEYMNSHRVEEVKKMLLSPKAEKYTLLTIANESGFSSKSSFNAIFKKMTGLTPKEYKLEVKNKKV